MNNMIKQTKKKVKQKKADKRNNRTLRGGLIYGEPGSFGITLGDPPLPSKDVRQRYLKLSGRPTLLHDTSKSKNAQKKTGPADVAVVKETTSVGNDDTEYVSKIFFDENNIRIALKAIDYITQAIKSTEQTPEQLFGNYLVLPRKWPNGKYYIDIDRIEYMKHKFQSDEYWQFYRPKNPAKSGPQTELRDKFKSARKQIQYKKAIGGDLDSIKLNSPVAFTDFMNKFRNIAEGIDLLHTYRLVHHDVKLGNMLSLQLDGHTKYLISDLDSIRQLDFFTEENYEVLKASDNSFDFERLFINWAYEAFPSCITLLAPVLLSKDGQINSSFSENLIATGLSEEWNNNAALGCEVWFTKLYKNFTQILPANKKQELLINIKLIFLNKYGNQNLKGDFMNTKERQDKYNNLVKNNKFIANVLNSTRLPIVDIRDILLKYVDVYGFCMSLLWKINELIASKPTDEPYSDDMIDYFINAISILKSIMTSEYFEKRLYEQNLVSLYQQLLP